MGFLNFQNGSHSLVKLGAMRRSFLLILLILAGLLAACGGGAQVPSGGLETPSGNLTVGDRPDCYANPPYGDGGLGCRAGDLLPALAAHGDGAHPAAAPRDGNDSPHPHAHPAAPSLPPSPTAGYAPEARSLAGMAGGAGALGEDEGALPGGPEAGQQPQRLLQDRRLPEHHIPFFGVF